MNDSVSPALPTGPAEQPEARRTAGEFDPAAELPTGLVVLEASAGTGKTYAIAGLAARYLAEGKVRLSELLLVTFGRSATAELRRRVRDRLDATARLLADPGASADPQDRFAGALSDCSRAERALRLDRVNEALAGFDSATIATTHEFCHRMLGGLGVLADYDASPVFTDDLSDLVRDAAADVYVRRYANGSIAAPADFTDNPSGALPLAFEAVRMPDAGIVQPATGVAAERAEFALEVRDLVAQRKRERRLFTYDDQLTRLRSALLDPATGDVARERLGKAYRVVLVDEFQDTDPIQWDVLRLAFSKASTLILIGDPKQAIYAFRGADVHCYLAATNQASVRTLTRNHRAGAPLVSALNELMAGTDLGHHILVPRVSAARAGSRLRGLPDGWGAAVRIRQIESGAATYSQARRAVRADLVRAVHELLASGAELRAGAEPRGLLPSDIAVLVSSNKEGARIAQALVGAGTPAVFAGAESVYASVAASAWLSLLRALAEPRRRQVREAMLTPFFGVRLAQLAVADDEQQAAWGEAIISLQRTLKQNSVAALFAEVSARPEFAQAHTRSDADRLLTDLRQIAQLLHAVAESQGLGAAGLRDHLAERMRRTNGEEATRRLETDEQAVQVLTIHRSKGLEFPVVLLPDLATRRDGRIRAETPVRFHDQGRRMVDLGGPHRDRSAHVRAELAESRAEDLRLLYVALTRASEHVTAWWEAAGEDTWGSPLQRLLCHDLAAGGEPAPQYPDMTPLGLGRFAGTGVLIEAATASRGAAPGPPPAPGKPLSARRFTRAWDTEWRRTSYTGLTAQAHSVALVEPMGPLTVDEPASPAQDDDPVLEPARGPLSLLAGMPGGTAFGTLVHAVFEHVDPGADDLVEAVQAACQWAVPRLAPGGVDAAELAVGVLAAYRTPLGPLAPGRSLADYPARHRLAELAFELPLGTPDDGARLRDLAQLLDAHLEPDDPLAPYADRLADPGLDPRRLRGFLVGSIDAVLREPAGESPRYLVVDYKTNRLGPPEDQRLEHYAQPALAEAMMASHYPLQALLYCVALHRFLRWRQPGYSPQRHLGGVLYAFVRGMAGPGTPTLDGQPHGVFAWRPSPDLVSQASDLLAGRRP